MSPFKKIQTLAGGWTFKIFLLILAGEAIDSVGQIFMKTGLPAGDVNFLNAQELSLFFAHTFSSPLLWLGLALYSMNFFIWIAILSQMELSLAVPLTSVSYALLPALAVIFLHEKITWTQGFGICLIILGVYFVSKNANNKESGVRP